MYAQELFSKTFYSSFRNRSRADSIAGKAVGPPSQNYHPQLEFEVNVAEYVMALHREIKPPTVPKTSTKIPRGKTLRPGFPIYGPKFIPPSFNDARLRISGKVKAQTVGMTDFSWRGWQTGGPI
ncbi:hypothetical protein B0H16DRAFT_1464296 [Mycena metata]|uniref:Uncharacterized protein n=1 Tax=Mycena metata TaxID=1033252 RepID=A0AAD7N1N6_9AGAR|nr:hypothetical protein B0H16DRAFT_1464296 [Mycena metata]